MRHGRLIITPDGTVKEEDVDSSGNGHRLNTFRPTLPQGSILGGFMGTTIQKTGKFGQTAVPIGTNFGTYV